MPLSASNLLYDIYTIVCGRVSVRQMETILLLTPAIDYMTYIQIVTHPPCAKTWLEYTYQNTKNRRFRVWVVCHLTKQGTRNFHIDWDTVNSNH